MFSNQKFLASVYDIRSLPKNNLPEVVLCGRSNVGKSSFINSIFNRKNLAKTSSTPGKTRSINYYQIDENFNIVDLPGYGYAKASVKEREKWAELINEYFTNSKNIALVIHLVDSRHDPSELDIKLNSMLKNLRHNYLVILNKADKLNQSELIKSLKNIKDYFPEVNFNQNLYFYSAVKGIGLKEIKKIFSSKFY